MIPRSASDFKAGVVVRVRAEAGGRTLPAMGRVMMPRWGGARSTGMTVGDGRQAVTATHRPNRSTGRNVVRTGRPPRRHRCQDERNDKDFPSNITESIHDAF